MCRKGTGTDMEYTREKLSGYLVHIGDHQKKSLRCRVGCCQSAGLQSAMHCAGCACFTLHLNNLYLFAEHVLKAMCCPFIDILCHGGRRSDGIDTGYLAEHISYVRSCLVTVTCNEFLCCHI